MNLLLLQSSVLVLASVARYQSGVADTSLANQWAVVNQAQSGVNNSEIPLAVSALSAISGCWTSHPNK